MTMSTRRTFLQITLLAGAAASAPASARPVGFFAKHQLPIGMQLYTVGDVASKDLDGTFAKLSAIGYRTIELAGFHDHTPQQLRAAADQAGLRITSIHLRDAQLGKTDEDARKLAADLAVLGTKDVVLPMFIMPTTIARRDGEDFAAYLSRAVTELGVDHWKRTAALLNARGAALHREGLSLAYHNHNIEFAPIGGTTGWEIIEKETDPALISFEVDAGWVAAAGHDPIAFVSHLKGRVRAMHVKDILASTKTNFAFRQDPSEVGGGTIDWARLLPASYAAGVRQYYVEQEPPFTGDRFASLAKSFGYLSTAH
jgi:sugar phosphate isomerase/epimerase